MAFFDNIFFQTLGEIGDSVRDLTPFATPDVAPDGTNLGLQEDLIDDPVVVASQKEAVNRDLVSVQISDGTLIDKNNNLIPQGSILFKAPDALINTPEFNQVYGDVLKQRVEFKQVDGQILASHPLLGENTVTEFNNNFAPQVQQRLDLYAGYRDNFNPDATDQELASFYNNVSLDYNDLADDAKVKGMDGQFYDAKKFFEDFKGLNDEQKEKGFQEILDTAEFGSGDAQAAAAGIAVQIRRNGELLGAGTKTVVEQVATRAAGTAVGIVDNIGTLTGFNYLFSKASGDNPSADIRVLIDEYNESQMLTGRFLGIDLITANNLAIAGEVATFFIPGFKGEKAARLLYRALGTKGAKSVGKTIPFFERGTAFVPRSGITNKLGTVVNWSKAGKGMNRIGEELAAATGFATATNFYEDVAAGDIDVDSFLGDVSDEVLQDLVFLGLLSGSTKISRSVNKATNNAPSKAVRGSAKIVLDRLGPIGSASRKYYVNLIDGLAPIKRVVNDTFVKGKSSEGVRRGLINLVDNLRDGFRTQAETYYKGLGEWQAYTDFKISAIDAGKYEDFQKFFKAKNLQDRFNAGQVSGEILQQSGFKNAKDLSKTVKKATKEQDAAYKALVGFQDRITNLAIRFGFLNDEMVQVMKNGGVEDYVRVQRQQMDELDKGKKNFRGKDKTNNRTEFDQRIKGSSKDTIDPIVVLEEFTQTIFQRATRNDVSLELSKFADEGLVKGITKVVDPKDVAKKQEGIKALKKDLEIKKVLEETLDDTKEILENAKAKADKLNSRADEVIDVVKNELKDTIATGGKLRPRYASVLQSRNLSPNKLTKVSKSELDEIAIEIISSYKNSFAEAIAKRDAGNQGLKNLKKKIDTQSKNIKLKNDEIIRKKLGIKKLDELTRKPNGEGVMAIYENGHKGYLKFDESAADIFQALTDPYQAAQMGRVIKALNLFSRVFRRTTTGVEPAFVAAVNPIRDSTQSFITQGTGVFNLGRDFNKHIAQLSGVKQQEILDAIDLAVNRGTYVDVQRLSNLASQSGIDIRLAQKYGKTRGALKSVSIAPNKLEKSLQVGEDILSKPEEIMRINNFKAAYMEAILQGRLPEEAVEYGVYAARYTTTRFANVGASMKNIQAAVPYLNARLQGATTIARAVADDPVGVGMRLLGFGLAVKTIMAHNLSDPEMLDTYSRIPDYDKDGNVVIVTGPGEVIKIPLPQEIADFTKLFVISEEAHHGIDRDSYASTVADFLLNFQPADTSGFTGRDFQEGGVGEAIGRAFGSVAPVPLKVGVETITNTNLFTGGELYYQESAVIEKILGGASDTTKAKVASAFKSIFGTSGQYVINALDKMIDPDNVSGRDVKDSISRRLFDTSYDQKQQDFYTTFNYLEDEKLRVRDLIAKVQQNSYNLDEASIEINEQEIKSIINDYVSKVYTELEKDQEYYEYVGGLEDWQVNKIIELVDFSPETEGVYTDNDRITEEIRNARSEAQRNAREIARDRGVDVVRDPRYATEVVDGQVQLNNQFNFEVQDTRSSGFGAREDEVFAFEKATQTQDFKAGKAEIKAELDAAYDEAAETKNYDKVNELNEEYNRFLDKTFGPLFQEYGVTAVLNNYQLRETIGDLYKVPYSLIKGYSSKRDPFLEPDGADYIINRYGLGNGDDSNKPTSETIKDAIEKTQKLLDDGKNASAQDEVRSMNKLLTEGLAFLGQDYIPRYNTVVNATQGS